MDQRYRYDGDETDVGALGDDNHHIGWTTFRDDQGSNRTQQQHVVSWKANITRVPENIFRDLLREICKIGHFVK